MSNDKQELRERVWDDLEESGEARFPFPPHDRIPNFAGAEKAAERLVELDAWKAAAVIKSNPDSPQLPVRRAALRQGKVLYVAVPRLQDEQCFLRLDPRKVDDIDHATTVGGAAEAGEPVGPEEMEPIDLIVAGSVAVTENGRRIGKGEGYSDLEFAVLSGVDLVAETTVVTTVHERQVLADMPDPEEHDVPLDLVVTPERTIETETPYERPDGLLWDRLDEERIEEMPILSQLRRRDR